MACTPLRDKVTAMRLRVVLCLVAVARIAQADRQHALADLLARTDALAREVSHLRGLPLKHAIPNDVVDAKELRARLDKAAADKKTAAATAAEGIALARWGLIPPATPYTQLLVDLLADQIAGYYDADTKKLTISESAGDDASWAEMVLAHELDHGLQDQSFDLNKLENLPDSEGDALLARRALVEGDGIALMVELMYARHGEPPPWGDPTVAAELERAIAMPAGDSLDQAPLAVRETMLFPYRDGFGFVAALRRRQSWGAVDAAFARPPRSTEQILHVDKYVADEKPIAVTATVPASLPGFSIVHSTVWGELGFDVFLRAHGVGETVAQEAAAGWGGDRAIVLARGDRTVGLARLEWDTQVDALEAQEAAVRAIDDAIAGGIVAHTPLRTEWLAVDGTSAWVERRGASLVIAIGVPSWAAESLASEAWTTLKRK
jgi:hypothetical protein